MGDVNSSFMAIVTETVNISFQHGLIGDFFLEYIISFCMFFVRIFLCFIFLDCTNYDSFSC